MIQHEVSQCYVCVRKYYKNQDEMIAAFEDMQLEVDDAMENAEDVARNRRLASILSKVSFFINLVSTSARLSSNSSYRVAETYTLSDSSHRHTYLIVPFRL